MRRMLSSAVTTSSGAGTRQVALTVVAASGAGACTAGAGARAAGAGAAGPISSATGAATARSRRCFMVDLHKRHVLGPNGEPAVVVGENGAVRATSCATDGDSQICLAARPGDPRYSSRHHALGI